jgi:hypothetical protein
VVGGGIGTILVVLLVLWRWPPLARLGRLHKPVAELEPPDDPHGESPSEIA